ncbi:MAG: type II toxin-antitoxin system YafQ family toxin, partial [Eggerthellaceae bacterium]|nr:type II toxin-antitoxin system YafQ family toxin [Eggerthellaceae bacterium]
LDLLWNVVEKLSNGETLDAKYLDHSLKGKYIHSRECHIEPDWLLIYAIRGDVLTLSLNRVGTHSELFRQ